MTDGSIRFLAGLSLAALAVITGIVSYLHALTVVYITGSAGLVAYLIPFVADLMIVTASLAILDAIRHHAPKPPLAMVSLVAGIGSTLAMNIVAGLHISAGGALVAALPPVAFVLSLETLMGIVRLARAGDGTSHLTATSGQCPHQVAMSAEDAVITAYLHARDCLGEPVSQRQLSATFGVPRPKVATLVGTLNGTRPDNAEEDVTERVSLTHQQPTLPGASLMAVVAIMGCVRQDLNHDPRPSPLWQRSRVADRLTTGVDGGGTGRRGWEVKGATSRKQERERCYGFDVRREGPGLPAAGIADALPH